MAAKGDAVAAGHGELLRKENHWAEQKVQAGGRGVDRKGSMP